MGEREGEPASSSRQRGSRRAAASAWLTAPWLLTAVLACGTGGESRAPGQENASAGSAPVGTAGTGAGPALDPGHKGPHRLNTTEYNATVEDVLGTVLQPANGSWSGEELAGFDNIASVLGVTETQYDRYFSAAQALATEVMASPELRARFVTCELSQPACVTSSIEAAGLRLFRRPLEPEELFTYQRVYDSARGLGDDEAAAFTLVLRALLASAEFLYRIELDPKPESSDAHRLGGFELASRLSYFLWSSAPDDALLRAAADGSLAETHGLAAAIERMLEDPKSQRLSESFAGQWLGARQVPANAAISDFAQWTPSLAIAAGKEVVLFFSDFLKSDRSWLEFPTADFNEVNEELAYFYGIPREATDANAMTRVEHHADERAGFFGLAGFLAISSLDRRTSPSRRGRWIASTLLCAEPPPAPANVAMLEAEATANAGSSADVRARLEQHRTRPDCAACHALFDPYGLALEQYDAIGRYRTTYDDGAPVDVTVTLPPSGSHPEGETITGRAGLAQAVAADPRFVECVTKKLFTYGLGRRITPEDEPYLRQARADWLNGAQPPSLRRLIHAFATTDAFRSRRGGG